MRRAVSLLLCGLTIVAGICLSSCARVGFDPLDEPGVEGGLPPAEMGEGGDSARADVSSPAEHDEGGGDVGLPDSPIREAGAHEASTDGADGDWGTTSCGWASGPPLFGPAVSLGNPNTAAAEADPVLSHDGLTLYLISYRTTSNDVYYAIRSSVTASFGVSMLLSAASTSSNETHFSVGPDDLEAFVSSDRTGTTGGSDIFRATRPSPGATWGSFSDLAAVSSSKGDFDPHLEGDRLTLWLAPVDRSGGAGMQDLFYATRASPTSAFGAPVAATPLNSSSNEWDVSLTDDGLTILFKSDRGGAKHVYYSLRASRASTFGTPAIVTALDPYISTLVDPWISPDGCRIYFGADLVGGAGLSDIYVVTATP